MNRFTVSMLETADSNTAFGCPRKFHFQYVQGIRPPQEPSAKLGDEVHASIENYLRTGINGLHPVALNGKHLVDPYLPREKVIEHKFAREGMLPLPFVGRIDLLVEAGGGEAHNEIVDWKTTSAIARYAKTVGQLRESTQLLGYAEWFYRESEIVDPIRCTLIYFQTRGRAAERVTTVVDREFVAAGWIKIEGLARFCLDVAREPDISQVEADLRKCDIARGCPFSSQCPRRDPLGINPNPGAMMSLLDRFRAVVPAETQPSAQVPALPPSPIPPQPPPPSDPPKPPAPKTPPSARRLLVADAPPAEVVAKPEVVATTAPPPEEKFEPIPPPRKGPGRPRKGAAKDTDFQLPREPKDPSVATTAPVNVPVKAAPAPTMAVTISRVSVTHGLTINLGNYQSAKVEVTFEASGANVDAFREELSVRVKAALEQEARPYLGPVGTVVISEAKK